EAPAPAGAPAMPAAKAEAARTGVDLGKVEGTGRGGRILKEDVQKAAQAPAAKPAPAPKPAPAAKPAPSRPTGERVRRVKMRPLRKTIDAPLDDAQLSDSLPTHFKYVAS